MRPPAIQRAFTYLPLGVLLPVGLWGAVMAPPAFGGLLDLLGVPIPGGEIGIAASCRALER